MWKSFSLADLMARDRLAPRRSKSTVSRHREWKILCVSVSTAYDVYSVWKVDFYNGVGDMGA